jgi:hypothetical protein
MTIGLTLLELSWASIRDFGGEVGGGSRSLAELARVAFTALIFVDHDAEEQAMSKVNVMNRVFISLTF